MEGFLEPRQVSQNRLAVAIGVRPRRINEIVHGELRITAGTALRLACYFGASGRQQDKSSPARGEQNPSSSPIWPFLSSR